MTADGIVSEFETTDHYLPFKCVQCGLEGFVEPTRRKRIYCGTKCNDMAFADRRKAETAQRRQAKIDQLKARTEKACTKCGEIKPVSAFSNDKSKLDGLHNECKECRTARNKEWASKNLPRLRELGANRRRRPDARVKILDGKKQYRVKNKYNPKHILYSRIQSWMNLHFKTSVPSKKWAKILGYTPDELKAHLEKQFTKGMSWERKSEIHVDHILPVSSFNITSIDHPDFHACYGLQNLRPMWAKDNMSKGKKILFLL